MSAAVPELSHRDVEHEIDELYKRYSRSGRTLFAFFGTGQEAVVDTKHAGRYEIVPVESELDLREQLPALGDKERRIAFLVPWTGHIPLDLAGRFALSGRIHRIGSDARLRRLFGVNDIDDSARRSPLASYLLRIGMAPAPIAGSRLTVGAMCTAWLGSVWNVPTDGGLAADTLVGWAALDARGSVLSHEMDAEPAVRDAVFSYLNDELGAAARVAFAAWMQGRGQEVLEHAILFETLAKSDDRGVRVWVKHAVGSAFGIQQEAEREAVAQALGAVAAGALRYVERHAEAATVRAVLHNADARIDDSVVANALADDNRLPSAWHKQLERLGAALASGARAPSPQLVAEVQSRLHKLESHHMARDPSQLALVKRAWMAARLLAWLTAKPQVFPEPGAYPYSDAESLAEWYAAEGGFVDLARRRARRTGEGAFAEGVQAVVAAADVERQSLDRRFARSLAAWVSANRPETRVVPIDHAIERIAVPFLEQDEKRRLLILLLDGMAWAQAVEILADLGDRHAPWGPLAWHQQGENRIGDGPYPPVLANLPTVTEVSRSAFFASAPAKPGSEPVSADDPKRWRTNQAVARLLPAGDAPQLLLRAESHTGDGSASQPALSLVGDASRRVVAIVINAIDASLKGDAQQEHEWKVDSIRSLRDLLEKARESGRAVLLASDHGHVPSDRLEYKASDAPKGSARYRPWSAPDDPVQDYEVGFAGPGVYAPSGAHGVVLLADDTTRFGSLPNAGEHGGASLAEVVAPCVLIGCEETLGVDPERDRAQAVMPAHTPPWWHLDLQPDGAAPLALDNKAPRPKRKKNERQLALPAVPDTEAKPLESLAASALLKTRAPHESRREQVVRAVSYLVERNGIASATAFAEAMGVLPFRVTGFVTTLGEVLNVDGYQVIRYDHASQQVRLDRELLEQQFEVKL